MWKLANYFNVAVREYPTFCNFPFLFIVLMLQILSIFNLLMMPLEPEFTASDWITVICWITFLIISFYGYVFQHELIMLLHIIGTLLMMIWFMCALYLKDNISVQSSEAGKLLLAVPFTIYHVNRVSILINGREYIQFIMLFVNAVYTWMCFELVKVVHRKKITLRSF